MKACSRAKRFCTLLAVCAGVLPVAAQDAAAPAPPDQRGALESTGQMHLRGLSETAFNPRAGTFYCEVTGVKLSSDAGDVQVLLNGQAQPQAALALSAQSLGVDYELEDGLNELLVHALDTDGGLLAADALVYAGSATLVVDVVDAGFMPVPEVAVKMRLAENGIVQHRARSNGTVTFENVPRMKVIVTATHARAGSAEAGIAGDAGPLLLQLPGKVSDGD